jgi:hypothetical protein
MQLQLHHTTITGNSVKAGLMWLRLVNTTLADVSITSNAVMQRHAAPAVWDLLKRGPRGVTWGDVESWPALDVCNVDAHYGALLQVEGPAGFDMLRWGSVGVSGHGCLRDGVLVGCLGMGVYEMGFWWGVWARAFQVECCMQWVSVAAVSASGMHACMLVCLPYGDARDCDNPVRSTSGRPLLINWMKSAGGILGARAAASESFCFAPQV